MLINNCKVVQEILKEKERRWYVVLDPSFNNVKTMKKAVYVWLKHNPSFMEIPKGYAIHHLDHDSLNDDPSNLALMEKHHHLAHHLKNKKTITPVCVHQNGFLSENNWIPYREPRINKENGRNIWVVSFFVMQNKNRVRIRKSFASEQKAIDLKNTIWPGAEFYS